MLADFIYHGACKPICEKSLTLPIPDEHKVFSMPKLTIREQMAAYKEIIDRSSLEAERKHPTKEHDDR